MNPLTNSSRRIAASNPDVNRPDMKLERIQKIMLSTVNVIEYGIPKMAKTKNG